MLSRRNRAFTLIELLVTLGIIGALIALLFPVVGGAREHARRAEELSSLRQLCSACIAYAQNNGDILPQGRMASAAPGADDYTWINYTSCWKPLMALVPNLNSINSCLSVRNGYENSDDFGIPATEYGMPDDTRAGWIYWGGRDDLTVNGSLKYCSLRRLGQHPTPGSQTLWTCLCWDSAGKGGPSACPHVGKSFVTYPNGVTLSPPPDGLCVALDDGSASFVRWTDLIIIPQANGWKLYYQP